MAKIISDLDLLEFVYLYQERIRELLKDKNWLEIYGLLTQEPGWEKSWNQESVRKYYEIVSKHEGK